MSSTSPLLLRSERLHLVPCSAAVARAADFGGAAAAEELLGIRIDHSWPASDLREILLGYAESLEEDPSLLGWGLWLILDADDRELIGDLGLKGKPDEEGAVEIGYGIIDRFRRRGFATEAVRRLIDWVQEDKRVQRITARCYAVNVASIGVLQKLGFRQCGLDAGILEWELVRGEDRSWEKAGRGEAPSSGEPPGDSFLQRVQSGLRTLAPSLVWFGRR